MTSSARPASSQAWNWKKSPLETRSPLSFETRRALFALKPHELNRNLAREGKKGQPSKALELLDGTDPVLRKAYWTAYLEGLIADEDKAMYAKAQERGPKACVAFLRAHYAEL